VILLRSCNYGK